MSSLHRCNIIAMNMLLLCRAVACCSRQIATMQCSAASPATEAATSQAAVRDRIRGALWGKHQLYGASFSLHSPHVCRSAAEQQLLQLLLWWTYLASSMALLNFLAPATAHPIPSIQYNIIHVCNCSHVMSKLIKFNGMDPA